MFTMWAALPTSLVLSADLRQGQGGLDTEALETLTNPEVIAINQDPAVQPMRCVLNASGLQVWRKPVSSAPGALAVVLFFRGAEAGPLPVPPAVAEISVDWEQLGLQPAQRVLVRDLWARADVGSFSGSFAANVTQREAKLFTFVMQ
jgi:alpha-galactosidase